MRVEVIKTLSYSVDLDKYVEEWPTDFEDYLDSEQDVSEATETDKRDFVSDTISEFYGPEEVARNSHIFREVNDDAEVTCY